MGWLGDQWADVKYTLSRRKPWELGVGTVCILLAIVSIILCFIFTIVSPPGVLGEEDAKTLHHQRVAMLYRRSVDNAMETEREAGFLVSKEQMDKAIVCANLGRDSVTGGRAPSEAAQETLSCMGLDDQSLIELEKTLVAALSTENTHEIMSALMKVGG